MPEDLLCDATARVTPTSNQSIGRPDNVPVEEHSSPYLAGHKGAAQDPDEESYGVETAGIVCSTGKSGRYRPKEKAADKG